MADAADDLLARAVDAARGRRFAEATALARLAMADPAALAGPHGPLLRMLSHDAAPEQVARLGPPRLNGLVGSGWLLSLYAGLPVNAEGEPLPWITYPAIDFLEPKIDPGWSVLEFGCGQSTRWWASRARRVVSVEHDPAWHARVSAAAPPNVTIHLRTDDAAYADLTGVAAELFDVVLIDGGDRNRAARTAAARCRPTGLIVFDNADRVAVRDGLAHLSSTGWHRVDFVGLLPSYAYRSCTSVFFRDPAILSRGPLPCDARTSLGPTLSQVVGE